MKCPHCHREFDPPPKAKAPYEYRGSLKEHLSIILAGLRSGKSPESIAMILPGQPLPHYVVALVRYVGQRHGLIPQSEPRKYKSLGIARQEHAWLLRAEGLKFRAIGKRLGVSATRARELSENFGHRVSKSLRITRWKIETAQREGISNDR